VTVASAAATLFLNEKARRVDDAIHEMGDTADEESSDDSISAKLKKRLAAKNSEIEKIKMQLQEHNKMLNEHAKQLRNNSRSRH
jgi:septal ring factor EnvC (AmiA/AmiB activator)